MKKIILSMGLVAALAVTSAQADNEFTVTPLVGFDLGYTYVNVDASTDASKEADRSKVDGDNHGGFGGLKLGARNEHYRIYVDAKYYYFPEFDYMNTYGAQVQYLYPMTDDKTLEFYIGANAGLFNTKYDSTLGARIIQDLYVGIDLGLNYQINDTIALEFGLKYMSLDVTHSLLNSAGDPIVHTMSGMTNIVGGITFALDTDEPFTR